MGICVQPHILVWICQIACPLEQDERGGNCVLLTCSYRKRYVVLNNFRTQILIFAEIIMWKKKEEKSTLSDQGHF